MLRNCLGQDRSETCLRSLAVSVFYHCLRQKIVLQIQIQVLVNTLAPTKYFFWKLPWLKKSYIHELYFNTGKLLQNKWTQNFLLLICYTSVNILFPTFASRHLRDLDNTRPIVSERAKTTPSHGVGWLSSCLRSCCWDSDRKPNCIS